MLKLATYALRLLGDIEENEVRRALRLMLSLFALMWSYYVLKTVREPLILATGGAELKAYAGGMQAVVLMFTVGAYSKLASRVGRAHLIRCVLSFFLLCMAGFALAYQWDLPLLGLAFYIWVGIFSVATVAQFWSFANDLYSRGDGERLFAIIAIGQAAGAAAGSKLAQKLFEHGVGVAGLLLCAAVLLALHLWLYPLAEVGEGAAIPPGREDPRGGFTLVLASPYLRLLAGMLILLNLVNTTGEYILSKFALEAAKEQLRQTVLEGGAVNADAFIHGHLGAFFGSFFFDVNLVVVVVQALVVSRLIRRAGFGGALFVLPVVAIGTNAIAAVGAGMALFRTLKVAENACDYSIMNTAKAMAWLPTSTAEKYKAKQALDTFFVRMGDVICAAVVFAGTEVLSLQKSAFAYFNLGVIALWLWASVAIVRRYRNLS